MIKQEPNLSAGRVRPMITSRGLDYFYAVAFYGSIRSASVKLRIAPSAVSRQISLLEDELGLELIMRHARGIRLTEPGEQLYKHIHKTQAEESALREAFDSIRGLRSGSISICLGDGFGHDFISNVLGRFNADYPEIEVHLEYAGSDRIISALSDDEVDIGLVYGADIPSTLTAVKGVKRPLVMVVAKGHPLEGAPMQSIQDLKGYPLALSPISSGMMHVFERALQAENQDVESKLTIPSIEGLIDYALCGFGVSLVPAFSADDARYAARLTKLTVGLPLMDSSSVTLLVRSERRLPPAVSEMLIYIQEHLQVLNEA